MNTSKKRNKYLCALGILIAGLSYIFVLYPAWQISFGLCAYPGAPCGHRRAAYGADRYGTGKVCEAGAAEDRIFKGGKGSMKKTVLLVILAVFLIALVPLFALKNAEFGGSDDAGSVVVEEVDSSYEAWATPVLEVLIGGELPGEVESLFFCIQTGLGVGVIAFLMGRFVERKKWMKEET